MKFYKSTLFSFRSQILQTPYPGQHGNNKRVQQQKLAIKNKSYQTKLHRVLLLVKKKTRRVSRPSRSCKKTDNLRRGSPRRGIGYLRTDEGLGEFLNLNIENENSLKMDHHSTVGDPDGLYEHQYDLQPRDIRRLQWRTQIPYGRVTFL